MSDFTNRVAMITGASGNLGSATGSTEMKTWCYQNFLK